jgi:hypothetical protein
MDRLHDAPVRKVRVCLGQQPRATAAMAGTRRAATARENSTPYAMDPAACYKTLNNKPDDHRFHNKPVPTTQRERLAAMIASQTLVRAGELRAGGIAGTTIQRALASGDLLRVGRGHYQNPHASMAENATRAEVAKRIPKGVIAMVSALAWHGLTDQMPRATWVAIGTRDWMPAQGSPPVRAVRFADHYLDQGVERHIMSGVEVRIYNVVKTLADLFRNGRLVDRSVAIEGLRAALEQRKASPADIADAAKAGGAWSIMRPYLEALTFHG